MAPIATAAPAADLDHHVDQKRRQAAKRPRQPIAKGDVLRRDDFNGRIEGCGAGKPCPPLFFRKHPWQAGGASTSPSGLLKWNCAERGVQRVGCHCWLVQQCRHATHPPHCWTSQQWHCPLLPSAILKHGPDHPPLCFRARRRRPGGDVRQLPPTCRRPRPGCPGRLRRA